MSLFLISDFYTKYPVNPLHVSFAVIVAVSGSGNEEGLTRNLSVLFKGGHEIFVPPPAGSKAIKVNRS